LLHNIIGINVKSLQQIAQSLEHRVVAQNIGIRDQSCVIPVFTVKILKDDVTDVAYPPSHGWIVKHVNKRSGWIRNLNTSLASPY